MFHLEQEEYKKENIAWSQIVFTDNQKCIELIENPKAPSLFKLLDEECMIKGTDENLLKKYNQNFEQHKHFKKDQKIKTTKFIVVHYAGPVEYDVNSFLEKNRDSVGDIVIDTLMKSESKLLSNLF